MVLENALVDTHLDKIAKFAVTQYPQLFWSEVFDELSQTMPSSGNRLSSMLKFSLLRLHRAHVYT